MAKTEEKKERRRETVVKLVYLFELLVRIENASCHIPFNPRVQYQPKTSTPFVSSSSTPPPLPSKKILNP